MAKKISQTLEEYQFPVFAEVKLQFQASKPKGFLQVKVLVFL